MTKILASALLALGLAPGVALAQNSSQSPSQSPSQGTRQNGPPDTLQPTHDIGIVDLVAVGTDAYVLVVSTVEIDGHRMGAHLHCNQDNPEIRFQFSAYPANSSARLWVSGPGQQRVHYGPAEQGSPGTGFYSPIVRGDPARVIARNMMHAGAMFGDSASVRLGMPSAAYASFMSKMPCF